VLGTATAPLAGTEIASVQIDWANVRRQQVAAAWFMLLLLAPLALLTILARNGLPQYWTMMVAAIVVAALTISLPFPLAKRFESDKNRALWLGPLTIIAGLIALLPTYLHSIGSWIIGPAALVSIALLLRQSHLRAVWAWAAILILATIYLAFEIGGNKYVNFFADRLALFGRTDGDIFAEGAIVGSILSYGWPSMAIDGLAPLKYHVGSLWVAARVGDAGGASTLPSGYVAAIVHTRIFILTPLIIYASLQATILFNAIFRSGRAAITAAGLAFALGIVIFIAPYAGLGNATFNSETMNLGAALGLLVFPSAFLLGSDPAASPRMRHIAWAAAALAIYPISASKISMGFVVAVLFGWWLLRLEGPRRPAFWLWGGVGFLVFLAAFLMFNDDSAMGAYFFGKPYYVEYGFERGDWLLPVTFQIETILALIVLAVMRGLSARRFGIETLILAAVAGNAPGLLMYIQSGNAAYFLLSQAWIAVPILAALLPAAWEPVGARLRGFQRWAPAAVIVVAVLATGYASYSEFRTRGALFIDANALLRSGDLSYYADDKRKVWRGDAKRALKEIGLVRVLTMPAAAPTGAELAYNLRYMRELTAGRALLYVPANNIQYWSLVVDCDGKSVFPMAMAGLAMIDGYVPRQADCPQEIALRGFGTAPEVRPEETPKSICVRARQKGFDNVLWLNGVGGAADSDPIDCTKTSQ
jgi:hypothetical protein